MSLKINSFLPEDICTLYEIHNHRNAIQILTTSCNKEFDEIIQALQIFRLTVEDILKPGGNESEIPKKLSGLLRKKGWQETRIKGDLLITKVTGVQAKQLKNNNINDEESEFETSEKINLFQNAGLQTQQIIRKNFLDGHKIDYVKGRIAFDLEWNSKDQTFDRDLYSFRAFYECNLIDAAIILTRSESLNTVFEKLGPEIDSSGNVRIDRYGKPKLLKSKYGASTTWMGKLLYRLEAGRHGGCPVLALGITPELITNWTEYAKRHL